MRDLQREFTGIMQVRSAEELARLDQLRMQHGQQLELEFSRFGAATPPGFAGKRAQRTRDLDQLFARYQRWVRETLEIEPHAHLTVAAVLTN